MDTYDGAMRCLRGDRDVLTATLDSSAATLPELDGLLAAAWPDLPVDRQRRLVELVVERVVVHPTARRGDNRFQPERVEVIWKR